MDGDEKYVEHRIESVNNKTNDGARGDLRKEAEDAQEKHETVLAEIGEALEGSMACE